MIVCPRCSKENQDHYKFCLGCGAELPKDAEHAPKSFTAPTPPAGFQSPGAGPASAAPPAAAPALAAPPPAAAPASVRPPASAPPAAARPMAAEQTKAAASKHAAAAGDTAVCPSCGASNPGNYKFCGACGYSLVGAQKSVAPPPATVAPSLAAPGATLVLIRPDGSEGESFTLPIGMTVVGRDSGTPFNVDSYLSPKHAQFSIVGTEVSVKDAGSLNGVYFRIDRDVDYELAPGDVFRIGQEILRYEPIAASGKDADGVETMGSPNADIVGRLSLVIGRETSANSFPVYARGTNFGRERGDVIFPEDGYVSGLHCRVRQDKGKILLTDVGSSNGTFLRIKDEKKLKNGALLLLGQQLFRVQF